MADAYRELLFKVSNHHGPDAGRPPFFDPDVETRSVSYFENAYGEQSVFVEDLETGERRPLARRCRMVAAPDTRRAASRTFG